MKGIFIILIIFGIVGIVQSKANKESVSSAEYGECDHDCLACNHLDVDCEGDDFFLANDYLDMEEDWE